ncbi:hypothetical protein AD933_12305 [Acetobacter malorum]|uniref:Uncharacterized protein n=1 Tax=Acetobacter malorum TaxID=178901 RepID=A0A149RK58_9PROT|nr:hypothetical protein AD933_12305 [Acetobacter malorum]
MDMRSWTRIKLRAVSGGGRNDAQTAASLFATSVFNPRDIPCVSQMGVGIAGLVEATHANKVAA